MKDYEDIPVCSDICEKICIDIIKKDLEEYIN